MRSVSSAGMVTDFSLWAKSWEDIVATLVRDPSGNGWKMIEART